MNTKSIDPDVLADYNAGIERNRLRKDLGLIEFARTCELLGEYLPPAPAVVYDIGGGYGEYTWFLASQGYEAHLFDLSETNIRMSAELRTEYPDCHLAAAEICDARSVPRPDQSADAVLLMGPLYHIIGKDERLAALAECRRLLKPGGVLLTAAITPYAPLLWATTVFGAKNRLLEEAAFMKTVERELTDGEHIRSPESVHRGLGRAHFHRPKELMEEMALGGFSDVSVHAAVGAAWLAPDLDNLWQDKSAREALLSTVRLMDGHDEIMALSTHIVGAGRK